MMRIKKIDVRKERLLCIGMVVSTQFVQGIVPFYSPELIQSDTSRIICNWCLEHFETFNKAPGKLIQKIYDEHVSEDNIDEDNAEDLAELLDFLSKEFEKIDDFDYEYYLKICRKYLQNQQTKHCIRNAGRAANEGEFTEAQAILEGFKAQELSEDLGFNPFTNVEKIQHAFESFEKPLFTYPGALGKVFNNQFSPGTFVAFLAPAKRGKTWILDELAFRAHAARNSVALFQIGDLSEAQQIRRLHVRLTGKSYDPQYCGEIKIPVLDCHYNQTDECTKKQRCCDFGIIEEEGVTVDFETANAGGYKPCIWCKKNRPREWKGATWYKIRPKVKPLEWREGLKAGEKWMRQKAGNNDFTVVCRSRMTTKEFLTILDIWAGRGKKPKVGIIDYFDLLDLDDPHLEKRHKENEKWRILRKASIDYNLCLIGATQSDTAGMKVKDLTNTNFSESGRKWDHPTAIYALNQTGEEKARGEMRIAPLIGREGRFDTKQQAVILQSLECGKPYLGSYFR